MRYTLLCPDDKTKNQHYPRRAADDGCRALLLLCCVVYTSTQVQGSKTHFVGDLQMRYALKVSYFTLICSFFPSIPCRLSWCFGFNLVVVASGLSFAVTRGEGEKKVLGHVELTYQTFDIEHMLPWFWRASFLVGFVCTCLQMLYLLILFSKWFVF